MEAFVPHGGHVEKAVLKGLHERPEAQIKSNDIITSTQSLRAESPMQGEKRSLWNGNRGKGRRGGTTGHGMLRMMAARTLSM